MFIKLGFSKELDSLLEEYANMLAVVRVTKLSDEKFSILKNFFSDYLVCEKSFQQCLTLDDIVNLLQDKLWIHPFNVNTLKTSCKHFCSSKVENSLQRYKQQLDKFLSSTSVVDFKNLLSTQMSEINDMETVTLKLDESWWTCDIRRLERLIYHFFRSCAKAFILKEVHSGCVCITWIVPTSIVPKAIVKAKQLSPEYLARKGVIELVIGLRIAPNEGLSACKICYFYCITYYTALLSRQSSLRDLSQNGEQQIATHLQFN